MSIEKQYGKYIVTCDICDDTLRTLIPFESWVEARDAIKPAGWKSKRDGDTWIDICPDCLKGE